MSAAFDQYYQDYVTNTWVSAAQAVECAAREVAEEWQKPSTIYRPRLSIDGDMWCALYGENLQDGVAGFGKSPKEAIDAFNAAWNAPLRDKVTT